MLKKLKFYVKKNYLLNSDKHKSVNTLKIMNETICFMNGTVAVGTCHNDYLVSTFYRATLYVAYLICFCSFDFFENENCNIIFITIKLEYKKDRRMSSHD